MNEEAPKKEYGPEDIAKAKELVRNLIRNQISGLETALKEQEKESIDKESIQLTIGEFTPEQRQKLDERNASWKKIYAEDIELARSAIEILKL